jgi:hypothetical protein
MYSSLLIAWVTYCYIFFVPVPRLKMIQARKFNRPLFPGAGVKADDESTNATASHMESGTRIYAYVGMCVRGHVQICGCQRAILNFTPGPQG